MIADYINPHGKQTKQFNSIEYLLEQVIKGTYEYGEDKILQTTLPKAMIDHAFELYREEHAKTWDDAMENMKARGGNDMRAWADFDDYFDNKYKK